MKKHITWMIALGLMLAAPAAYAQSPAAQKARPAQKLQLAQRLREGIKSGQLTKGEAKQLRERLADIRKQARELRKDGKQLTPEQRAQLKRELKGTSRMMFRMRHNRRHRGGR